jgi:serpin B
MAPVQQRVVAGSNRLGFQLIERLLARDAGKNLFVSPASIVTALTMTWTGAEGETAAAMAGTLGFPGAPREDVAAAVRGLLGGLGGAEGIELRSVQAIWARSGIAFREEFVERARRSFGARVQTADFRDARTLAAINDWISEQTGGRIRSGLDRISPDAVMYLLSAIWFKAQWLERFDATLTVPEGTFRLADGRPRRVSMMQRSGRLVGYEDATMAAVKLPYTDKKTSMVILLPADRSAQALAALATKAVAMDFPAWLRKFADVEGRVELPRFEVEYGVELQPVLTELGMGVAFDEAKADFSGMRAERDILISRVLHKSFVEVNEEGTEAAAVTIVEMGPTSAAEPSPRFELIADRPFLFVICDDERGAVLFAGAMLDPGA